MRRDTIELRRLQHRKQAALFLVISPVRVSSKHRPMGRYADFAAVLNRLSVGEMVHQRLHRREVIGVGRWSNWSKYQLAKVQRTFEDMLE
ncbi:hypothetical protein LJR255_003539 [Pararhizobium sp. LjRoot255]|uniref:hypothetical protein n=1 Tax=Pararhizobium sp. LjRoot255 TaxID=3342298 RepID=UPI003ECFFD18